MQNAAWRRRDALTFPVLGFASSLFAAGVPFRGLRTGLASYSTRSFTLDQTIALCRRLDLRYLTLKSFHLPLDSTSEQRREVRDKLRDAGIELGGCGVIYLKTEEAARKAFDYVQELGAKTAVIGIGAPMVATVEKVLRDFDVRVAIHNHGPKDSLGAFSPLEVLGWIRDAGPKIGICMDIGHTFRCGHEPSEVAVKCAARLYDVHMKDLDKDLKPVPVGQGTIDIVRLMKTLLRLGYRHHLHLEYEADRNDPAPGIADSIGYQRGVLAALETPKAG